MEEGRVGLKVKDGRVGYLEDGGEVESGDVDVDDGGVVGDFAGEKVEDVGVTGGVGYNCDGASFGSAEVGVD